MSWIVKGPGHAPFAFARTTVVRFRRLRQPLWRPCGARAGFSAALRHTRHTSRTCKQDGSLTSSGLHAKFSPAAARWPSRGPYDHMSAGPHSGRRRGAEAKALDRYGHNGDAIRWERLQQSDGWPQPATPWLAPDVMQRRCGQHHVLSMATREVQRQSRSSDRKEQLRCWAQAQRCTPRPAAGQRRGDGCEGTLTGKKQRLSQGRVAWAF